VTGTTPATLGSELVTNGTFDTSSDWTLGTGWTITGGEATAATAPGSNLDQSLTTTAGKYYVVEYSITSYTSGDIRFRFTGVANINGVLRSSVGTFSEVVFASSVNNVLRFTDAGGGFTGSIDNVSVKEVLTWADPKYYLDFDGVDDFMKSSSFTALSQPISAAVAFRSNSIVDFIYDGHASNQFSLVTIVDGVTDSLRFVSDSAVPYLIVPYTDGADTVVRVLANGASSVLAINGAENSGPVNATSDPTQWTLGDNGSASAGNNLDGRIYGFVAIDRTLDPDEITDVEGYLADKTGAFTAPVITGVPTISVS
jgi:hypothetical protein